MGYLLFWLIIIRTNEEQKELEGKSETFSFIYVPIDSIIRRG